MNVAGTLFLVAFGLFLIAFFCTCCMGYSSRQRQRQQHQRAHNHLLIAVIPASTDGSAAQNRFDGNYWGPPPPPYTPMAPDESTTDHTASPTATATAAATSPSFISNRLQTASPPPRYESPPPYF